MLINSVGILGLTDKIDEEESIDILTGIIAKLMSLRVPLVRMGVKEGVVFNPLEQITIYSKRTFEYQF